MKNKNLLLLIVVMGCLFGSNICFAQQDTIRTEQQSSGKEEKKKSKFGSFIKKVGEATTGINMTNEMFIVNPDPLKLDIEFVECKGNTSGQYFEVVLKIKNKSTNDRLYVGAMGSTKAFDSDGNSYETTFSSGKDYDIPTNVPVKVSVKYVKVLPSVAHLELINVGTMKNGVKYGVIELHNVPVVWE